MSPDDFMRFVHELVGQEKEQVGCSCSDPGPDILLWIDENYSVHISLFHSDNCDAEESSHPVMVWGVNPN